MDRSFTPASGDTPRSSDCAITFCCPTTQGIRAPASRACIRQMPPYSTWRASKAGRTFVTNAPLLTFTVNGHEAGDEFRLPSGTRRVRARVTLRSSVPIDHLEIVGNGKVVAKFTGRVADTTVTLAVDRNSWFVARAFADKPRLPVLYLYPFAST